MNDDIYEPIDVTLLEVCRQLRDERRRTATLRAALVEAEANVAAMRAASEALLESLGEYVRQSMDMNPEWRSGIRQMQAALAAVRRTPGGG